MDAEFWLERWHKQEIGFHRQQVHPQLAAHFQRLPEAAREQVFVPLCGKSLDMLWLTEQGARVIGSELSDLAIAAFADENALNLRATTVGAHIRHEGANMTLWQGDFFTLSGAQVGCGSFYDRAALVALPPTMRRDYVVQLQQLLRPSASGLLITFAYNTALMSGPPFSTTTADVHALFHEQWHIEQLSCQNVIAQHPGMHTRGLQALEESVWLLTRR